jgi:hypothetical protein
MQINRSSKINTTKSKANWKTSKTEEKQKAIGTQYIKIKT